MLVPSNWSVVVVGHWNRAILQPGGIARRVFGLEPNTPINVDIPLDSVAPFRVHHNGIVASVPPGRLVLELETASFEVLERARTYAANAIRSLPETPFKAAGINLKYSFDAIEEAVEAAATSPVLGYFADAGLAVTTRSSKCRAVLGSGSMQMEVTTGDATGSLVHFNYELVDGGADALREWLAQPLDEAKSFVDRILNDHFSIQEKA